MFSGRFDNLFVKLVCHTCQVYLMTKWMIVACILTRLRVSTLARLSRITKYTHRDVFAVISLIWSYHARSCENVTPSRRVQFTRSVYVSFIVIGGMFGVFFFRHIVAQCLLMVVIYCVNSSPAVWSELSTHEGEHDSHIVQTSTYLT